MATEAETVKSVANNNQFTQELVNAGTKVVVVDFHATWCGPCHRIAPVYEDLSKRYTNVIFLKVDVDVCETTAAKYNVTAMPAFLFFRNRLKIDEVRGADPKGLEETIKKWAGSGGGDESGDQEDDCIVKGHMDLNSLINKSCCECLNEADDHPLANALINNDSYLESDCDEQLIIAVEFNQAVKLHSLRILAPEDKAPKTIKLFINQPRTLDFDSAESMEPIQKVILTADDLKEDGVINLKYVKLQNVSSVTVFVKDNIGGEDVTQIGYLGFIGSPVESGANMSDFKRVAGKKGESH